MLYETHKCLGIPRKKINKVFSNLVELDIFKKSKKSEFGYVVVSLEEFKKLVTP